MQTSGQLRLLLLVGTFVFSSCQMVQLPGGLLNQQLQLAHLLPMARQYQRGRGIPASLPQPSLQPRYDPLQQLDDHRLERSDHGLYVQQSPYSELDVDLMAQASDVVTDTVNVYDQTPTEVTTATIQDTTTTPTQETTATPTQETTTTVVTTTPQQSNYRRRSRYGRLSGSSRRARPTHNARSADHTSVHQAASATSADASDSVKPASTHGRRRGLRRRGRVGYRNEGSATTAHTTVSTNPETTKHYSASDSSTTDSTPTTTIQGPAAPDYNTGRRTSLRGSRAGYRSRASRTRLHSSPSTTDETPYVENTAPQAYRRRTRVRVGGRRRPGNYQTVVTSEDETVEGSGAEDVNESENETVVTTTTTAVPSTYPRRGGPRSQSLRRRTHGRRRSGYRRTSASSERRRRSIGNAAASPLQRRAVDGHLLEDTEAAWSRSRPIRQSGNGNRQKLLKLYRKRLSNIYSEGRLANSAAYGHQQDDNVEGSGGGADDEYRDQTRVKYGARLIPRKRRPTHFFNEHTPSGKNPTNTGKTHFYYTTYFKPTR